MAGWGLYSLLVGYKEWFGNYPQKVFVIMSVVYVGFQVLESIKKKKIFEKIVKFILTKD